MTALHLSRLRERTAAQRPGEGHASLQFIVGNFRELGQMTEQPLERTVGVNGNG